MILQLRQTTRGVQLVAEDNVTGERLYWDAREGALVPDENRATRYVDVAAARAARRAAGEG